MSRKKIQLLEEEEKSLFHAKVFDLLETTLVVRRVFLKS